jgi:hypothetical protein
VPTTCPDLLSMSDGAASSCWLAADLPRLRSREDLVERLLQDQEAMGDALIAPSSLRVARSPST